MVNYLNADIDYWDGTAWHTWNPGSPASFALAVGDPNYPNDIWTIDNSQNVYFNTGSLTTGAGNWVKVPQAVFGRQPGQGELLANEIALSFSSPVISPVTVQRCGSPPQPVHSPIVTDIFNEIYVGLLNQIDDPNCADITWYDTGGVSFGNTLQPLASDLTVGTDNNLYGFMWSSWGWQGPIAPKPTGGLLQVASGPSGIWGLDGNHVPNQLMECLNTSPAFCVPAFYNALFY